MRQFCKLLNLHRINWTSLRIALIRNNFFVRIHSCQMAYFFSSPLKPFKKKGPHSFRHTNLLCSLKDFYCSHNLLWPSCILKGPAKSPCDDQATGTHMGSKFFLYEYIFLHQLSFHEIILKFSYNMYILIRIIRTRMLLQK